MKKHTNRLIDETSPYLMQHAHNPVDWYPWVEEAFAKARAQDKPLLLSVGYAACHWCHVMEKESFENESIAEIMNKLFVNIKVDREERPDIDQIYMNFLQMFTGSGGWPMTIFLTPDQRPFYGGTYFPAEAKYGRPSFDQVLQAVADFYHTQKDKLNQNLREVEDAFQKTFAEQRPGGELPDKEVFLKAAEKLSGYYEPEYGGIGDAPKFPTPQVFSLFLRKFKYDGGQPFLDMVTHTLKNMARGGIFDQLGGGFARYSVDKKWFAPHFEKMLYDNAQLAVLYLDTFQVTGDDFFLGIAEKTLDFVSNELTAPEGGFYSSIDADSEGVEGKFYLWDKEEITGLLGKSTTDIFCDYYNVSDYGNFEHRNILHITEDMRSIAEKYNKSVADIEKLLDESRQKLLKRRVERIRPGLDDKIIASWNGLMLSAFARAFQITSKNQYRKRIQSNVEFLKSEMFRDDVLLHTYKDNQAKFDGYLDDYANVIQGLIDAYEALFDISYLEWAVQLTNICNKKFWDDQAGGYFYTAEDQEKLIIRLKDEGDQSIPSGSGIMLMNLLRLFHYTESQDFEKISHELMKKYSKKFYENPYGYGSYLNALDFYLSKPKEIVIVTEDIDGSKLLLDAITRQYLPNKILAVVRPEQSPGILTPELLKGKTIHEKKPTAYICQNFTCSAPVTSAVSLSKLLAQK